jgi:hypothetical protein
MSLLSVIISFVIKMALLVIFKFKIIEKNLQALESRSYAVRGNEETPHIASRKKWGS